MRAVKLAVGLAGLLGVAVVPGGGEWTPGVDVAQSSEPSGSGDTRRRAEDLAKGASERFNELVGNKDKTGGRPDAVRGRTSDRLAEQVYAWVSDSGRQYQGLVRRLAQPVRLNPVEDAARRHAAEQRRAGAPGTPASEPPVLMADAGLIEQGVEWIHRSGRDYQELMRRLSVPAEQAAEKPPEPVKEAPKPEEAQRVAQPPEEAKKAEQAKAAEEARQAEEARRMAEAKKAEEDARRVAEAKKAEEMKQAEEARRTAEAKKAEEARQAEEARRTAEAKKAEDEARRAAEAKRAEEARQAEEARRLAEAKKAEDAKKEEDARRMAEAQRAEEARQAEKERRAADAKRAEDAKKEEDARRMAEAQRAEEARQAEEGRRAADAKKAEETRPAAHTRKAAETKTSTGSRPRAAGVKAQPTQKKSANLTARKLRSSKVAAAKRRKQAAAGGRRSKAERARACRFAGGKVAPPGWYVVKQGDTLWRIASRHYHKGRRYRILYEANAGRIDHPNLIYPCQRLYIPKMRWRRD